jgi:secreted trypsin-like serine protease
VLLGRKLSVLLVTAIVVTTVVVCSGIALAITYGQPDGNRHPNVGALVDESGAYCSGTLISPTVFLTAAHCGNDGDTVSVTFASEYTSRSKTYEGTFHADTQLDLAVVVFKKPIRGITPAQLPTLGQLDDLPKDQQFTVVGYGVQEPVRGPGGPTFEALDRREFSVAKLNSTQPDYLQLSQNPARGHGGACYGDSGGPNFLGAGSTETDIIAAITITGDAMCRATNTVLRLDTEEARAFLGQYVTLS